MKEVKKKEKYVQNDQTTGILLDLHDGFAVGSSLAGSSASGGHNFSANAASGATGCGQARSPAVSGSGGEKNLSLQRRGRTRRIVHGRARPHLQPIQRCHEELGTIWTLPPRLPGRSHFRGQLYFTRLRHK